jgi:hypothetical protein
VNNPRGSPEVDAAGCQAGRCDDPFRLRTVGHGDFAAFEPPSGAVGPCAGGRSQGVGAAGLIVCGGEEHRALADGPKKIAVIRASEPGDGQRSQRQDGVEGDPGHVASRFLEHDPEFHQPRTTAPHLFGEAKCEEFGRRQPRPKVGVEEMTFVLDHLRAGGSGVIIENLCNQATEALLILGEGEVHEGAYSFCGVDQP